MDNSVRLDLYKLYLREMGITDVLSLKITDDLVNQIFFRFVYPTTKLMFICNTETQFVRQISKQLNFTRLTLLNLKYRENENRSKGIKEGFVYCITNPAYPKHVKFGSSVNVYGRLNSYQTYSPFKDFSILSYFFAKDRWKEERNTILLFNGIPKENEWVECDKNIVMKYFLKKRNDSGVMYSKEQVHMLRQSTKKVAP